MTQYWFWLNKNGELTLNWKKFKFQATRTLARTPMPYVLEWKTFEFQDNFLIDCLDFIKASNYTPCGTMAITDDDLDITAYLTDLYNWRATKYGYLTWDSTFLTSADYCKEFYDRIMDFDYFDKDIPVYDLCWWFWQLSKHFAKNWFKIRHIEKNNNFNEVYSRIRGEEPFFNDVYKLQETCLKQIISNPPFWRWINYDILERYINLLDHNWLMCLILPVWYYEKNKTTKKFFPLMEQIRLIREINCSDFKFKSTWVRTNIFIFEKI